ncbi:hypothetical protein D3C72_767890 [compost metagenome]
MGLSLLTVAFLAINGCKKPADPKTAPKKMNGEIDFKKFSFDEILEKLPQSVLYNLGDQAVFYTNESETQEYSDGSKVLRFPISEDRRRYIYAVKSSNPDVEMKVYLRHIIASSGSFETNNYNAVEDIIDVESWTVYRQEFANNRLSKYYDEVTALTPGWEQCAVQNGDFIINGDGLIDENPHPPSTLRRGPYDCPPNPNRGGGSGWIRRTLERVGDFFRNLTAGDGMANDDAFYPPYTGGGGYNIPPGEGGSGGGGGTGNPRMADPYFNQPHSAPGFEQEDLGMLWVINPSTSANDPVLAGNFRDGNGFINNRKTALQAFVSEKPFGIISCADINAMEDQLPALQNIASYTPPQSVLDKVNWVANNNGPSYSPSNTFIQRVQDGIGVVNMDYFPVHIQQLPKNANGVTMTPLEFLEYFRKNLSHPTMLSGDASFTPYIHSIPGTVNINETSTFNSAEENSLGSMIRIRMTDNGTVILTDYHVDIFEQTYWFTFTTMATPLDGTHPVAGNRRFGIQQQTDGTWQFYTAGVDRCFDWYVALGNQNPFDHYFGFHDADAVWGAIQQSVINFVNSNQGQANYFTIPSYAVRAEWLMVRDYLEGNISLQQLKLLLGCP